MTYYDHIVMIRHRLGPFGEQEPVENRPLRLFGWLRRIQRTRRLANGK